MTPKNLPLEVDLKAIREEMGISQSEFAAMLAISPRTIQSCEQDLRAPSAGVEKAALLLLLAHRNGVEFGKHHCWRSTHCPKTLCGGCIAYLSRQGHLCWFLTGTYCKGVQVHTWGEKLALCNDCPFFAELVGGKIPVRTRHKGSH